MTSQWEKGWQQFSSSISISSRQVPGGRQQVAGAYNYIIDTYYYYNVGSRPRAVGKAGKHTRSSLVTLDSIVTVQDLGVESNLGPRSSTSRAWSLHQGLGKGQGPGPGVQGQDQGQDQERGGVWLVRGRGRDSCGNAGGPGICTVVFNSQQSALGKEIKS